MNGTLNVGPRWRHVKAPFRGEYGTARLVWTIDVLLFALTFVLIGVIP